MAPRPGRGVAAAAWPLGAWAQAAMRVIGSIHTTRSENAEALFRGLRDAGYVDGQNVMLETRYSEGALGRQSPKFLSIFHWHSAVHYKRPAFPSSTVRQP